MIPRVLYFCRGPENSDQFYFASELPEGYFAPGFFIIQGHSVRGRLSPSYRFAARQGEQEFDLELAASETSRALVVDAGANGKFYFKAVTMSRGIGYAGQLAGVENGKPLFRPRASQHASTGAGLSRSRLLLHWVRGRMRDLTIKDRSREAAI